MKKNRDQLLLQRINELLPILENLPEDWKDELYIRFTDELKYFRMQLQAGSLQLPLPEGIKHQINYVIREGIFESPDYNELFLRVCDVSDLLYSPRFPLMKWVTDPVDMDETAREQIWQLYSQAVAALKNRDLDSYFKLVWPALLDNDASLNYEEGHSIKGEGRDLQDWMGILDFTIAGIDQVNLVLAPLFHPGTVRITDANNAQSIRFTFTEADGHLYTPGICIMIGHIGGHWQIIHAVQ